MKTRQVVCTIILVSLGLSSAGAQSNFNIDEYYQFLNDHADLESQEILAMYPPPTTYWSRSEDPADLDAYDYLDSIRIKYTNSRQ